jgi:hypothetical protein
MRIPCAALRPAEDTQSLTMWWLRRKPMLETPQEGASRQEKAMFNDPESNLAVAHQREREFIAQAERDRHAKAAREHSRTDTKSHDRR